MKRLFSVLLAVLMTAAIAVPVLSKERDEEVVFTAETVEAECGSSVDLTVSASSELEFTSVTLRLNYDSSLTVDSIEYGDLVGELTAVGSQYGGVAVCEDSPDQHQVEFMIILGVSNAVLDGDLFTVTFNVPADATVGETLECSLSIESEDVYCCDFDTMEQTMLPYSIVDGGVLVAENSYTVVFRNWDGTELEAVVVEPGETPVYSGETPERPSADGLAYVFEGWDPEIVPAEDDAEYIAVFRAVKDVTNGKVTVSITSFDPDGSTVFTVASLNDAACAVASMNPDGSLVLLACTTTDGVHSFTVSDGNPIYVVLRGDVDGNGQLKGKDSTMLRRYLAGSATLTPMQLFAADIDGNGRITGRETTMLARAIVGSYTYTW